MAPTTVTGCAKFSQLWPSMCIPPGRAALFPASQATCIVQLGKEPWSVAKLTPPVIHHSKQQCTVEKHAESSINRHRRTAGIKQSVNRHVGPDITKHRGGKSVSSKPSISLSPDTETRRSAQRAAHDEENCEGVDCAFVELRAPSPERKRHTCFPSAAEQHVTFLGAILSSLLDVICSSFSQRAPVKDSAVMPCVVLSFLCCSFCHVCLIEVVYRPCWCLLLSSKRLWALAGLLVCSGQKVMAHSMLQT